MPALLDPAEIEFETHSPAAVLSTALDVVRVADLVDRLRAQTPLQVLNELFSKTSELLRRGEAGQRVALVSYRQERGTGPSASSDAAAYAHLTLDDTALRGVVAAAERLRVDALWCDAWCYRSAGSYGRVRSSVPAKRGDHPR